MQALEPRLKLPATFNRPYRDVVAHCKQYTMEELANLAFIGCLFAKHAPPGYQQLWQLLQPVVHHYIFETDATPAQIEAAAHKATQFAALVEEHVTKQHVCFAYILVSQSCQKMCCCAHAATQSLHRHRQVDCQTLSSLLSRGVWTAPSAIHTGALRVM